MQAVAGEAAGVGITGALLASRGLARPLGYPISHAGAHISYLICGRCRRHRRPEWEWRWRWRGRHQTPAAPCRYRESRTGVVLLLLRRAAACSAAGPSSFELQRDLLLLRSYCLCAGFPFCRKQEPPVLSAEGPRGLHISRTA
jgi:hypothetical protein